MKQEKCQQKHSKSMLIETDIECLTAFLIDQSERLNEYCKDDGEMKDESGQKTEFLMIESYRKWLLIESNIEIVEKSQEKKSIESLILPKTIFQVFEKMATDILVIEIREHQQLDQNDHNDQREMIELTLCQKKNTKKHREQKAMISYTSWQLSFIL